MTSFVRALASSDIELFKAWLEKFPAAKEQIGDERIQVIEQTGIFTIADIIASLPQYDVEIVAYTGRDVPPRDVKREFEKLLLNEIGDSKTLRVGSRVYNCDPEQDIINYEGTEMKRGVASRTGEETGGLKVQLRDEQGGKSHIMFRGSGTEPKNIRHQAQASPGSDSLNRRRALLAFLQRLYREAENRVATPVSDTVTAGATGAYIEEQI